VQHGIDPRKGVNYHADQRPVVQPDKRRFLCLCAVFLRCLPDGLDAVEQLTVFLGPSTRASCLS
jgi:hypothetical protein